METHYVDLHCHPSLKSYSKSFKYDPPKHNAKDASKKNSIWHHSPPNLIDKFISRAITLSKFTQTDMTALAKAKTSVVVVSLYPFEKHFLSNRIWRWKGYKNVLVNFASTISQKRIDYILRHDDYFKDLLAEYDFYTQLHGHIHRIDGVVYTYQLVSCYDQIEANLNQDTETRKTINIITSIEGGHSFNTGRDLNGDTGNEDEVLKNIRTVKGWKHRPLFLTFAHHFFNEMCGHARSINIGGLKDNQNRGLNTGITDLGAKAIDLLLDNTLGKRIPLDIKHMSVTSRKAYYNLLDTKYANQAIPVIASHGAANGKRSIEQWDKTDFPEMALWLNDIDINFYDSELVRIAKSKGLFGLQLDERCIGSKYAIKKSKMLFPNKRKQLKKKSLLVWRQIEHAARVLDKEGIYCWGIQSIGSDFDGIANPINGLWTAENIKDLGEELLNHARVFLKENKETLHKFNQIEAEDIVQGVLHVNAMEFIKRNY